MFNNVKFKSQGGYVESEAVVPIIRLTNFYLGGGFGGNNTTTYMTNGTVKEWWAMAGRYVISGCRIEGFYIASFAGTSVEVSEYLDKLKHPND